MGKNVKDIREIEITKVLFMMRGATHEIVMKLIEYIKLRNLNIVSNK